MAKAHINDIDIHYQVEGEGPDLLLLHGLGSRARDWSRQVDFFSQRFRVIACDLRGHGLSDKPPGPYSMGLFADDVALLLRELAVTSADVVGISMGGMIALQMAVDHPALVNRLVIVNSVAEVIPRTLTEKMMVWQRLFLGRVLSMASMARFISKRLFPDDDQQELRFEFEQGFRQNDKRAYICATRAILGWSVKQYLGSIRQPTLFLTGDRDYSPVQLKQRCVAAMPDAQLSVVKGSGHATPIDREHEFNQLLLQFLLETDIGRAQRDSETRLKRSAPRARAPQGLVASCHR
jgi:pimeloyl-ACP methyl ester carboxylesterase